MFVQSLVGVVTVWLIYSQIRDFMPIFICLSVTTTLQWNNGICC